MSIYANKLYLENNSTWHVEDSPWKSKQVLKLIRKIPTSLNNICEIGCGAGEILVQLSISLPKECSFTGYDISPDIQEAWEKRRSNKINFIKEDFLKTSETYDLLLYLDIIEHIEDYIDFLRKTKKRGEYKIFNFPLEIFAAKALFGSKLVDSRKRFGHIHYFNKDICLALLNDLGFEIIDFFYAPSAIDLSSVSTSISPLSKMAKIPRIIVSWISTDLCAKLIGGYSLFVLAR